MTLEKRLESSVGCHAVASTLAVGSVNTNWLATQPNAPGGEPTHGEKEEEGDAIAKIIEIITGLALAIFAGPIGIGLLLGHSSSSMRWSVSQSLRWSGHRRICHAVMKHMLPADLWPAVQANFAAGSCPGPATCCAVNKRRAGKN